MSKFCYSGTGWSIELGDDAGIRIERPSLPDVQYVINLSMQAVAELTVQNRLLKQENQRLREEIDKLREQAHAANLHDT